MNSLSKQPVYRQIASALQARLNCERTNNTEWFDRHTERIECLVHDYMPSGSGFDAGIAFDWDESTPERLVFNLGFHHMNENGMYDGWTEHSVIVKPSLQFGIDTRITGPNRNDVKEYLDYAMDDALHTIPAPHVS